MRASLACVVAPSYPFHRRVTKAPCGVAGVERLEGRVFLSASDLSQNLEVYNGHTYLVVGQNGISWDDAEAKAKLLGGDLVTINDAAENEFVAGLISRRFGEGRSAWIGFTDDPAHGGHEAGDTHANPYPPAGNRGEGWVWVSGEPVTFQGWHRSQPDDLDLLPSQNFGITNFGGHGTWDDYSQSDPFPLKLAAVIELPFAPESHNGHTYVPFGGEFSVDTITWLEAEDLSRAMGGHLVTINDAAENEYVVGAISRRFGGDRFTWIGFTDDPAYGGHEAGDTHANPYPPAGNRGEGWVWVSGEPVTYQGWHDAQPDNWSARPSQNFAVTNWVEPGKWDDYHPSDVIFAGVAELPSAVGRTYEAEHATISGAGVSTAHGGYGGTGFVDYLHATGDSVEFTVEAPAAGTYDLGFRYANGGTSPRAMGLRVGAANAGSVSFAPTGSWTTWNTAGASVALAAGTNTIRLAATGRSGPNLDALTVYMPLPETAGPTYQAESAVLSGAAVASSQPGYTGTGYVDYKHASLDSVEFDVYVPEDGPHDLIFRYANGGSFTRSMKLRIDGELAAGTVDFAPTGSWHTWSTATKSILLAPGEHKLLLTAAGKSGPNLDALTVLRSTGV
jgi:hypothetical protein